jgi:polysaccharide deacetylase family protein (PEP-CTERM system associated)
MSGSTTNRTMLRTPTHGTHCIFSVDVEDWFHILALPTTPDLAQWDGLQSRVEPSFRRLLDLFSEHGVTVTCFFLGWVAERFPALVREAAANGHEVASHGYAHVLAYQQTPSEFYTDVRRTKDFLEGITGRAVLGYRAPGFSVTKDTPWFFAKLAEAGYRYDSSVFPAPRQHGGMAAPLGPYVLDTPSGPIIEVPVTVARVLGRPLCFFGGGYLRLFPYALTQRMGRNVLREGRPVVFYVHPREIDPSHPRLPMGPARRFKSYVNLRTTEPKVRRILRDFRITTFEHYIAAHPPLGDAKIS